MTNKETLPAQLPGINISMTLEQTGISKEVLKKIFVKFAEKNRHKAQEMLALLAQGDLQGLSVMVHTLKGASATIGAIPLQEACLGVEKAVKEERGGEEIEALIGALALSLDEVVGSVASLA